MSRSEKKGRGTVGRLVLTGRGFGFVSPDSGPDILIPFDHLGTASSGDTVKVELFPESARDKPAGRVLEVVERTTQPIVGRVRWRGKELRLYPEGERINRALILEPQSLGKFISESGIKITNGDVMSAKLDLWDDPKRSPVGVPLNYLGRVDDPKSEVTLITLARGFVGDFPPDVEKAAKQLSLPRSEKGDDRRDLRDDICFTIDPDTARDFDDAMSIQQRQDGLFEVSIHIADVSHYVRPGDAVDREAWSRATSVYLVNTVIPMLPEALSNSLCSIVPNEDRLAMTVRAVLDSTGNVSSVEVFKSIIRSRKRFTYREVEEILHGRSSKYAKHLHLLHLVTQQLRRRRQQVGSVDLDIISPTITLDSNGVPVAIRSSDRMDSQRMVEESMLLANRLVARELLDRNVPGIYRVHDQPRTTDVTGLIDTLAQLGIRYDPGDEFTPDDYRNIITLIENLEFKDFVEALAVRSLNKAVYTTENRGHFGLAMDAYTHFTSPIRRYPDLVVHRLLKRYVISKPGSRRRGESRQSNLVAPTGNLDSYLKETCEHASARERAAKGAERAYTRLKALQFLKKRRGRQYSGTISGVTSFGLFVEIDRYLVEGLVHIATLGKERFELERANHRLVGQKTGTAFRLGDRVQITVVSVDTDERRAEFKLS